MSPTRRNFGGDFFEDSIVYEIFYFLIGLIPLGRVFCVEIHVHLERPKPSEVSR